MEPGNSLPCSQDLATSPYFEPDESSLYSPILLFSEAALIIIIVSFVKTLSLMRHITFSERARFLIVIVVQLNMAHYTI
jgi:hypothetical protein